MNNTNAEIQCYVEELLVDLDDTAYFKIPGEKGDKGAPGAPGAAGHTPVKGTDYWTAADKQEIVNNVLAALPDGTEVAY